MIEPGAQEFQYGRTSYSAVSLTGSKSHQVLSARDNEACAAPPGSIIRLFPRAERSLITELRGVR